jgi:hypothetical protein
MANPSALVFTQQFKAWVGDGTFDLDTNTIKVALLTNAWVPNMATNTVWGDISANEVAAANGYTAEGQSLTGTSFTQTGGTAKFTAANHTWTGTGAGFSARYEALYALGTLNGHVNPLIGYRLLDSAPADVFIGTGGVVVQENAAGIFTLA